MQIKVCKICRTKEEMSMKVVLALVISICSQFALAGELDSANKFWLSKAFSCPIPGTAGTFPSRPTGDSGQPCDDGDMTLFNGLLCAAGVDGGCQAVADALDPATGQWHRSPRIRRVGNDRGGSAFSPDMALGVQLYLVKTGDVQRAQKWLTWLHEKTPCSIELGGTCLVQGLPRFCTDDQADKGCTMRPGDAAALAQTVDYMQQKHGLGPLPDGRLRGYLGSFGGYGPRLEELSSMVNKPGFSQHLVAVSILLYRNTGLNDPKLQAAAVNIATKNPGNAFFSHLAGSPKDKVAQEILARCPSESNLPIPPLHQWQWERENGDEAWKHSCYWDCIFMNGMLSQ